MRKSLTTLFLFVNFVFPYLTIAQNNALSFDGSNDYLQTPNFSSSLTQGTFSFWIKLNSIPTNNARIMSEEWSDDEIIFNSGTTNISSVNFVSGDPFTSSSLPTGVWTHVAITADATGSRIYINGELDDTGGPADFSISSVSIGGKYTALWEVVPGQIDEFQIWNDVRTQAEIREFMYRELTGAEDGLVAYYKFNETTGSTANDASSNSYNATLNNMTNEDWVTSSAFFGPKSACEFLSDDYIEIPDDNSLDLTSNYTIEAWIYPKSFNQLGGIVSKYQTGASLGYTLRLTWDSPYNGISFDELNSANGILSANHWYHIAAVNDNGTRKVYVNGVEITMTGTPLSVQSNNDPVRIGCDFLTNGTSGRYFNGIIDEVRIWNDVRTATEIQENMCKSLVGIEDNLVAYYNLDDIGTKIIDYSGNANDGTSGNFDNDEQVASTAFSTWLNSNSTNWSTATNWSLGTVPSSTDNVGIDSQNTNPIVSSTADCNIFYLGSGASVTINDGASFWPRTNQFINNQATFTMQKSIGESGKWHLISSPNNSTTTSIFNNYYLQGWSEDTSGWYDITQIGQLLQPVKGYSFYDTQASKSTFSFVGTPNFGEQTFSLTYHDTDGNTDGMNLIGNPYPSSIDWSYLDGESYGAVYTWDPSLNEYRQWNNDDGNGSQYIAPGQGFFVATLTDKTFTINNDCRTHSGADNFYKNMERIMNGLILTTNHHSDLYIRFNSESSEEFELAYDAFKLLSFGDGQSEIYSKSFDTKFSIDCRPATETIQLGFHNNQNGLYSIELVEIEGISAELEDTKLNQFHDLSKGAYEFDWNTSDSEERFILHLKATGTEEIEAQDVQVYSANGQLYIRQNQDIQFDQLIIYDLAGRVITEKPIQNHKIQSFDLSHLNGAYLVQLRGSNNSITKKIIMK